MRIFIFSLLLIPTMMLSQDFQEYKWKKRVIVVESPTFEDAKAKEQVSLLKAEKSKFDDYKLLIIEKTNEGKSTDFSSPVKVRSEVSIKEFKISLIGLDGGVKYRSGKVISVEKFFSLIAAMPMYEKKE